MHNFLFFFLDMLFEKDDLLYFVAPTSAEQVNKAYVEQLHYKQKNALKYVVGNNSNA